MQFDYDTILTVQSLQKVGRSNKIRVNFDRFEPYIFSLDVINTFRLEKGKQISFRDVLDAVMLQMVYDAKQSALRYLERRPHSEKELRQKLAKKNYEPMAIDSAIDFLKEYNYINDYKYFEDYAQWLADRKYYGRSRVEIELAKRGANKEAIAEICDKVFFEREKTEYEFAKKIIDKRKSSINRKEASKRRVYIYNILSRYGISADVIRKILEDNKYPGIDEIS